MSVFFVSGRRESQRVATERNLRSAGYDSWEAVILEPDDAHFASAAEFKTAERAKLVGSGWTIIANVGDQPSDLSGENSERTFLVPNPFYRVP